MGCVNGTAARNAQETTDAHFGYHDNDVVARLDGNSESSTVVESTVKSRNFNLNIVGKSSYKSTFSNSPANSGSELQTDAKKSKKKTNRLFNLMKSNSDQCNIISNASDDCNLLIGTKLAAANEDPSPTSPTLSNGNGPRKAAQNGSSVLKGLENAGTQKPPKDPNAITPEKLHKNFQSRLLAAQLSRTCRGLSDEQTEFFRSLDEKIENGRNFEY